MAGTQPPSGRSPVTQPVIPDTSSQQDSSDGVSSAPARRYTPSSPAVPGMPLGTRKTGVQQNVVPQLNRHGLVQRYSKTYQQSHSRACAIENELDLASSLSQIRYLLKNPEEAKANSSFVILWVPDEGDAVSVIPPDDKMQKDQALSVDLTGKLGGLLDKLGSKYVPEKLDGLRTEWAEVNDKKQFAENQLIELGAELPPLQQPVRTVVLGGSNLTAPSTPNAGQPTPQPPSSQPASSVPNTVIPPISAEDHPAPNGQFVLNLPSPSERSEPQSSTAPSVANPLVSSNPERVDLPENDSELLIPNGAITHKDIPSEDGYLPLENNDLPPPPTTEDLLDLGIPSPTTQRHQRRERSQTRTLDPSYHPRPRANTTGQFPDTFSNAFNAPFSPLQSTSTAPIDQGPFTPRNPQQVVYSRLPVGIDGRHSDLLRAKGAPPTGNLATVNAGSEGLFVGGGGINKRFGEELKARGNTDQYARFHQHLVKECPKQYSYYMATPDDLAQSPDLAASLYCPKSLRGQANAGAIFLDVFNEPYLGGNSDNKAMMYVVPPNGKRYQNSALFLKDVKTTARNMVLTQQAYNVFAQNSKRELPVLPDLRVCASSTGLFSYDGADISEKDVGSKIKEGMDDAIKLIVAKEPLTIKNIELTASGAFNTLEVQAPEEGFIGSSWGGDFSFETPTLAATTSAPWVTFDTEVSTSPTSSGELGDIVFSPPPTASEVFTSSPETLQPTINNEILRPQNVPSNEPRSDRPTLDELAKRNPWMYPETPRQNKPFMQPKPQHFEMNLDDASAAFLGEGHHVPNTGSGNPPTTLVHTLQQSPVGAAKKVESEKSSLAGHAFEKTMGQQPATPDNVLQKAITHGRQHAARKALLTRAMVNFHRKHAAKENSSRKEARFIPNQAVPLIEMGALLTQPKFTEVVPGPILNQQVQTTSDSLMRLQGMTPELAETISRATNGATDTPPNLLAVAARDAEQIEQMRFMDNFDASNLASFGLYGEDGKAEMANLCSEYRDLLIEQKSLSCHQAGALTLSTWKSGKTERDTKPAAFSTDSLAQQESNPALFDDVQKQFRTHPTLNELYRYQAGS